jgi:large conductance mechanosensitive channel
MWKVLNDLKEFAIRGNVVDLAVGFTVGAAFSTIAKSLVDDIIMPVVGLLLGQREFSDMYILLRAGTEQAPPYTTLAEAQAAGAITMNYGLFINNILAFLVVAVVMFFLIRAINTLQRELEEASGRNKEQPIPTHKNCPFCLSSIPRKASRCPQCTSELEVEEPANSRSAQ